MSSSYGPDQITQTSITWGPLIKGIGLAEYTVQKDGRVSGTIDKRAFTAVSAAKAVPGAKLVFADGAPAPVPQVSSELRSSLEKLKTPISDVFSPKLVDNVKVSQQLAKVKISTHPPLDIFESLPRRSAFAATPNAALLPRGLDRATDVGHHSWTYDSFSCKSCKVLAMVGVVATETLCVLSTCWWSFGLGCVACTVEAATAAVAAIEGCEFSGACCPKTCGAGSFPLNPPSCCFGEETCLDNHGQCCRQDQQACAGKQCCNSGQTCIASGAMQGTCCPKQAVCGDKCCPNDDDVCVNGQCCRKGGSCGLVCCTPVNPFPTDEPDLEQPFHCANPARSLCCKSGEVDVGGQCCKSGEVLISGVCCKPGGKICGDGKCCNGECKSDGTCKFNPSDAECRALGLPGSCTGKDVGSPECEKCDFGCCQFIPR